MDGTGRRIPIIPRVKSDKSGIGAKTNDVKVGKHDPLHSKKKDSPIKKARSRKQINDDYEKDKLKSMKLLAYLNEV